MLQKLSEQLIAKIAAGEVIERPASVIKELVENSIDAGATRIEVELEEGGKRGISVVDDGCGMTAEEAPLALERHVTSKISCDEDLFQIRSLGFRGEALPSMAAVSWMVLETTPRLGKLPLSDGKGVGIRLDIEGGMIVKQGVSSLPHGTRITVRNLFFNTPARLKFLKTTQTEFSHASQLIEMEALAHSEITFVLSHQGKNDLTLPRREKWGDRIRDLLGEDLFPHLVPFQGGRSGLEIMGYCSGHSVNQSTSKGIYLFVNGRAVRDRLLQHAVMTAYQNLLMKGRYPWVVLSLKVPPSFVDVNVHPSKHEVRFAQSQVVHELVRETVRRALVDKGERGIVSGSCEAPHERSSRPFVAWTPPPAVAGGFPPAPDGNHLQRMVASDRSSEPSTTPLSPLSGYQEVFHSLNDTRVIGQIHSTYLICETEDKMILIDQHAAHERIGFEKLKHQFESGEIARQQLLIPQNFDMTPSETELLKQYLPQLLRFGIEVEFFGGHTFLLRSLPLLLAETDCVALLRDLVATLKEHDKLTPLEEKVHEILERMACHAQVRGGDRLSPPEIEALLTEMEKTDFAYSCPHGRPAILQIPFGEIEKWFKRKL